VSSPAPRAAEDRVRGVAAAAWLFRFAVELDAEARFGRLADRLRALGASESMVALARRSAEDEHRHAARCAELAQELGAHVGAPAPAEPRELAPPGLLLRGRVTYELVAACCITETESMGVLTTLLDAARSPRLRRVLHELASDEVRHARLGWAHLAGEHAADATAFLAPLVPAMLQGSAAPDLFLEVAPEYEDEALLEYGVLPHALKRQVFTRTLEEVVFPGLDACGVDSRPARAWLEARRAGSRSGAGG
jgi:rubrerythrin